MTRGEARKLPSVQRKLNAAALRELIVTWLDQNPEIYDQENSDEYIGDLESLRYQRGLDTQNSQSRCRAVANEFSDFIRTELRLTNPDIPPYVFTPDEKTWRYFGYTDRREVGNAGDDSHTMTMIVDNDGEIYGIDWTAGQFGYREFPMILHLAIDPARLGPVACANDVADRCDCLWLDDEPPGAWERITLDDLGVTSLDL